MYFMKSGIPNDYRVIETSDGSFTLYSESFQEACHSPAGAKTETLLHYIQGCQVHEKLAAKNTLSILEVGFGTGLGMTTTYDSLKETRKPVFFISLEIDKRLADDFFSREDLKDLYQAKWVSQAEFGYYEGSRLNFHFKILIGNARKILPQFLEIMPQSWDAIYQDAFSPKRNPVLWTREWFELLRSHSKPDTILSTYSAGDAIRKSMIEAGWKVYKGEKFGAKRTSTRARLEGETDSDILELLSRSPAKAIIDADVPEELFK